MVDKVAKKVTKKKSVKKTAPKKVRVKKVYDKAINTPEEYVFGRPTKYKRAYAQKVYDSCKAGETLTMASICCLLEIDKDTFYNWCKKYVDFSTSIKKGLVFRMEYMEKMGLSGIFQGKNFNAVPWIFLMKNMFPNDYRDRQEIKHGADDDIKKVFNFKLDEKPKD